MDQELKDYLDRQRDYLDRQFAEAREETNRRFEEMDRQYAELRQEVHEIGILLENLGGDVRGVADGVAGNREETRRLVGEVRHELREARAPMERALQEHGQRLSALESAAA